MKKLNKQGVLLVDAYEKCHQPENTLNRSISVSQAYRVQNRNRMNVNVDFHIPLTKIEHYDILNIIKVLDEIPAPTVYM